MEKLSKNYDYLYLTCSSGTATDDIIFSSIQIEEGTEVFDINYNRKETDFIKLASKYNVITNNGLKMLVNQGLLAHKIWFGKEEN